MEEDFSLLQVLSSMSYEHEAYWPVTAPLKGLALSLFPHRCPHYQLMNTMGNLRTEAKGWIYSLQFFFGTLSISSKTAKKKSKKNYRIYVHTQIYFVALWIAL